MPSTVSSGNNNAPYDPLAALMAPPARTVPADPLAALMAPPPRSVTGGMYPYGSAASGPPGSAGPPPIGSFGMPPRQPGGVPNSNGPEAPTPFVMPKIWVPPTPPVSSTPLPAPTLFHPIPTPSAATGPEDLSLSESTCQQVEKDEQGWSSEDHSGGGGGGTRETGDSDWSNDPTYRDGYGGGVDKGAYRPDSSYEPQSSDTVLNGDSSRRDTSQSPEGEEKSSLQELDSRYNGNNSQVLQSSEESVLTEITDF